MKKRERLSLGWLSTKQASDHDRSKSFKSKKEQSTHGRLSI